MVPLPGDGLLVELLLGQGAPMLGGKQVYQVQELAPAQALVQDAQAEVVCRTRWRRLEVA